MGASGNASAWRYGRLTFLAHGTAVVLIAYRLESMGRSGRTLHGVFSYRFEHVGCEPTSTGS